MSDFILWLLFTILIGWLAFPICFYFFKQAYDRGYFVAKIFGLFVWGYLYWIGNMIGVIENTQAGAITAVLIVLIISIIFTRKIGFNKIIQWVVEKKHIIIFHEIVFIFAFAMWAVVRAANPEIVGTEKPMELAFINGIYRSPSFPPNDPWLSGYSISYYYFGYLLVAATMHLVGTSSGIAFNLAICLMFALVAAASSGLLINLLIQKEIDHKTILTKRCIRRILLISLLAPLFILILSNAEGFLEVIHSKGIFWSGQADDQLTSGFWKWLDIKELSDAPSLPLTLQPGRAGGTWWWRASRVLQDYTVNGQSREIIDEFPFFSFLLADLHPHVLAMPFVLLVIYYGFYIYQYKLNGLRTSAGMLEYFKNPDLWFLAFITGSLLFLNTWDFPIYFGLISLTFIIPIIREKGWGKVRLREYLLFCLPFGIMCVLFYLPFLLGLSSQAGGFLPSLVFRTRAIHFLVMFFPQIAILTIFLIAWMKERKDFASLFRLYLSGLVLLGLIFVVSLTLPAISQLLPLAMIKLGSVTGLNLENKAANILAANKSFLNVYGAQSTQELIRASIERIMQYPLLPILLMLVLSICLLLLFIRRDSKIGEDQVEEVKEHVSNQYILIMIVLASLLALVPEFIYLRDQFGWRMNTIFKFYFQVWVLVSLASAYALGTVRVNKSKLIRITFIVGTCLVLGVGLIYPCFSILTKTNRFSTLEWSLDGNQYSQAIDPYEAEAIDYLSSLPYGTVVEAVGGSYTSYARVSKLTGFPTVLGWPGHELQWRGGTEEIGSRESDIKLLYTTKDWETARLILDQYGIDYIFIGSIERQTYQVEEEKFSSHLTPIFENEDIMIYPYVNSN